MKIEWKSCLRLGVTVFVTFLAIRYWGSLTGILGTVIGAGKALIIGCVIAYILNILMSFYEKHYFPKIQNQAIQKFCTQQMLHFSLLGTSSFFTCAFTYF